MRKIYQAVSQIFGEILGVQPDEVSPGTSLAFLRYQELASAVIACEKTFGITLEDERIKELTTAEHWVSYIQERKAEKNENTGPASQEDRENWYYS